MIRRGLTVIILFSLFLLLTSCSADSKKLPGQSNIDNSLSNEPTLKQDEENKTEDEATDSEIVSDDTEEVFIFPKEGVRPIAVMIDNQGTKCLPQGGLNKAQVIYEVTVEGGLTRLMPVFWNVDPEMVGPVRSARHYFLDYSMEHDAIYVHIGWSPMALGDIRKLKINNIDGVGNGGGVFWDITKDKNNWQDSYTSMEKIKTFSAKAGYRSSTEKASVFLYNNNDVSLTGDTKAEDIDIKYSASYSCSYTYDSAAGLYKRSKEGEAQIERTTGKQLTAKNIIIQTVKNYSIKGDDAGRQELNTVGKGNGMLITLGKSIKIKWSKASRNAPTEYVNEAGEKISLNPGQTWVQIVPESSKITIK